MALLLAVLEPLSSLLPSKPSPVRIINESDYGAWCIQTTLEPNLYARFVHWLELSVSAVIGTAVMFTVALLLNNIGPATRRYPNRWF